MKTRVDCYSGHKANERPIKFWLDNRPVFVESVEDQWRTPEALYFRVRGDDGRSYVLAHDEVNDEWMVKTSRQRTTK